MNVGAIVIGDEIMLGKRQDKHFARLIDILRERGMTMAWCVHLGDDRARLTDCFRNSFATGDLVFSFGGIGSTPDDHTRQAAADALGVPLEVHPEARRELEARFGGEVTPQRLRMAEFPAGARIVPNPYNRVPAFSVRDHHFLPGFPEMAWPMAEWILDTWYPALRGAGASAEEAVLVYDTYESALIELMQRIESSYDRVRIFSLPTLAREGVRRRIELGVRGEPGQVARAMADIRLDLTGRALEWEPAP